MVKEFCASWVLSKIKTSVRMTDPLKALAYVRKRGYEPAFNMTELVEFLCSADGNHPSLMASLDHRPRTFAQWDKFWLDQLIDDGYGILEYQDNMVAKLVATAFEVTVRKYKVLAVNSTMLREEIAAEICKGREFGVVFDINRKGWTVLLCAEENQALVNSIRESFSGVEFYAMIRSAS